MFWIFRLGIFIIFSCFTGCTIEKTEPELDVLAKVGNRVITLQDFIRRAEYSIRPLYCRQSNYIHKKIILNSLIAEKLFALEAEKAKVELLYNDRFQSFVRGRGEQAMRQLLYNDEFYKKVELDSAAVTSAYKFAGRTVDLTFINLPDLNTAIKIKNLVVGGLSLDSAYTMIWNQSNPPKRYMNWFDKEAVDLHKTIFNSSITKGSIIGPFQTDAGTVLLLQVNGWTDRPAVTTSANAQRLADVRKRLREYDAEKTYKEWVKNIMTGKKLELNSNVFPAYAGRVMDIYLKPDSVKQAQFNETLWGNPELDFIRDSLINVPLESFVETDILFHVDNVPWTIREFHQQLRQHPLVFRKRKMNRGEFREQLKFAIADLVRDIEITKQCYAKGYERFPAVSLNRELWHDSFIARYYRNILLEEMDLSGDDSEDIAKRLNPLVDSLQAVYSDQIEINTDLFETIELTHIDMTVVQQGVPFPKVVPPFPVFTTDYRLDYGRKRKF